MNRVSTGMNQYRIWCPQVGQTENTGKTIVAFDQQSAVEMWGDWFDIESELYPLVMGEALVVQVNHLQWEQPESWIVVGENRSFYMARPFRMTDNMPGVLRHEPTGDLDQRLN